MLKILSGKILLFCTLFLLIITSGDAQTNPALSRVGVQTKQTCLPTGVCLDAAGGSFAVGNMPLAMMLSPEGDRFILSLNGWREQGLQIVERETGNITQTLAQKGAFLGLAFSPDGKTLYASGGNEDAVYVYAWNNKQATLVDRIVLAEKEPEKDGTRFPAGIAFSTDGEKLYVAENLGDSLAVIDVASKKIEQRLRCENYPYEVKVSPDGKVFVSAWGGNTISVFSANKNGLLRENRKINVGRHPSALLLNKSGSRLFVASASTNQIAVVDTKNEKVTANLTDAPPSKNEGSTPNALALSSDETKLFVAEADNNAVAVFNLSKQISGAKNAFGNNRIAGRIPVEWYPTALLATKDSLFVLNGKGKGTKPNPQFRQPGEKMEDDNSDYTLGQLNGTITRLPANLKNSELNQFTKRVAQANNWNQPKRKAAKYPPFKHVIYIIKENRTYDQILSDVAGGDGDTSLQFFPRFVSPNHHALAERFGLYDRFFVNAEVSSQGHVWSTAAYVTDYGEKTIPSLYANKRGGSDRDDIDEPAGGYLWNAAIKKGLTLRDYGEFAEPVPNENKNAPIKYRSSKAALAPYTNPDYPAFDMKISDQIRADAWLRDFQEFVKNGNLPALEILHLPRDHTAGARAGLNTPQACFADNDLALGRIVEAVSNSPYWKDTIFFVLEDDAQDGPDHVDSHRSVLLAISAYNKSGAVIHRFVNTTDVFATMEEILRLPPLSQFDFYGRPLREIFSDKADLKPYSAIKPAQSLNETNPPQTKNAEASAKLDLDEADKADMNLFNRILWNAIKGENVKYPQTKKMPSLEIVRAR
ncbi:MAG: beta-propeller fold lactonase family protein [Pyrinomonadaceae bacterium]